MNHETLQDLYELDVQEVGEEEAAKRWEWKYPERPEMEAISGGNGFTPTWNADIIYRRKPGIPWPKVMQQSLLETEKELAELRSTQLHTKWPDDAPEWANYGIVTYYESKRDLAPYGLGQTLIERPKQKIDWSKVPYSITRMLHPEHDIDDPLSDWIAWNCDEHTRGNPLPDGLIIVWYEFGEDRYVTSKITQPNWKRVRAFQIVGIQENYE